MRGVAADGVERDASGVHDAAGGGERSVAVETPFNGDGHQRGGVAEEAAVLGTGAHDGGRGDPGADAQCSVRDINEAGRPSSLKIEQAAGLVEVAFTSHLAPGLHKGANGLERGIAAHNEGALVLECTVEIGSGQFPIERFDDAGGGVRQRAAGGGQLRGVAADGVERDASGVHDAAGGGERGVASQTAFDGNGHQRGGVAEEQAVLRARTNERRNGYTRAHAKRASDDLGLSRHCASLDVEQTAFLPIRARARNASCGLEKGGVGNGMEDGIGLQ